MARDKGGQGMKAPPVVKYRKNIGTYQRESTNKEVKRVYRDRADARKGKVPYKCITKLPIRNYRIVFLKIELEHFCMNRYFRSHEIRILRNCDVLDCGFSDLCSSLCLILHYGWQSARYECIKIFLILSE